MREAHSSGGVPEFIGVTSRRTVTVFKRLHCRDASPASPKFSGERNLLTSRLIRGLLLTAAIPIAAFLNTQLAGDELQPIKKSKPSGPTFKLVDEQVQPIRATIPDTSVKLLSHQEALPRPVALRQSRVELVRRGTPRRRAPRKPLPRIDDLVSTSRQSGNVEDLVDGVGSGDQFLNELRRSVNPVQELPLPESNEPEAPAEPAPLPIEKPEVEPVPTIAEPEPAPPAPEPIVERKIVEVIRVQSEPSWVVMNRKSKFQQRVLGRKEVTDLLTRARMELASGDVELAHVFAEAAAEVEIPIDVFKGKPELILSEIDYVTARGQAVVKVDYDAFQQGGPANPTSPTQRLAKDPRGFRAIGKTSMSIRPKMKTADGEAQQLPDPETKRQLALLPEIVQQPGFGRGWNTMSYSWEAPALYHSPLYFEQVELERYGNEICGIQPWVSAAHFYTTVFTLPYQMGIEDNGPFTCHYDLGHNRPGECVPYSIHALPFSWTGALTQGAVATGMAFMIP